MRTTNKRSARPMIEPIRWFCHGPRTPVAVATSTSHDSYLRMMPAHSSRFQGRGSSLSCNASYSIRSIRCTKLLSPLLPAPGLFPLIRILTFLTAIAQHPTCHHLSSHPANVRLKTFGGACSHHIHIRVCKVSICASAAAYPKVEFAEEEVPCTSRISPPASGPRLHTFEAACRS